MMKFFPTQLLDELGPLFHATSCGVVHRGFSFQTGVSACMIMFVPDILVSLDKRKHMRIDIVNATNIETS